ncbi:TagK domain-containing protein [Glaciimonas immobilis]|uniref:Uncharacterized protein n=1 Tax=Glaciimonas immobilis TaxID=728004 RepID=A0A840RLS1_9BURK|nr:TagK domain-containing protein [Glaciimonas immobilis]KAF3998071.1 TagK domain-containing protein [Glaciimonas immobilis]MBB5199237.1 hypothetical protein [Glaciimonas immobilis]
MIVKLARYGGELLIGEVPISVAVKDCIFMPANGVLASSDASLLVKAKEFVRFFCVKGVPMIENKCALFSCYVNDLALPEGGLLCLNDDDVIEAGVGILLFEKWTKGVPATDELIRRPSTDDVRNIAPHGEMATQSELAPDSDLDLASLLALNGPALIPARKKYFGASEMISGRSAKEDCTGFASDRSPVKFDTDDPLAALSKEYLETLRGGSTNRSERTTVRQNYQMAPIPQDPFSGYEEAVCSGSLLNDLLGRSASINAVLSELNHFNGDAFFSDRQPHEILSLFAPDGAPIRLTPYTGQLSQREHHMISLDSHFQIAGTVIDVKVITP